MDAPDDFWPALDTLLAELPDRIDELDELLTNNEIIVARTVNVAVVEPATMVNASFYRPDAEGRRSRLGPETQGPIRLL